MHKSVRSTAVSGLAVLATLGAGFATAVTAHASSPTVAVACDGKTVSVAKNGAVTGSVNCTATTSSSGGTSPVIDSYAVTTQPASAADFSFDTDTGEFSYEPTTNKTGTDFFVFTATSGTTTSSPATVTFQIDNQAPSCAAVGAVSVRHDRTLTLTPSCTDANQDTLQLASGIVAPAHGRLTISGTTLSYKPNARYLGSDQISFKASDGVASTPQQVVPITVTNVAPTCSSRTARVLHDRSSVLSVMCKDADGDALSLAVGKAQHGTVRVLDARHVRYTPARRFIGSDTFSFLATDGITASASARVALAVTDHAPKLKAPNRINAKGKRVFLVHTYDADRDPVRVLVADAPEHGKLTIRGHHVTYVPAKRFKGRDSFSLRASDGASLSNVERVSVRVRRR